MGIGTSVWWRPRGHVLQRGVCPAAPLYKTRKQWSSNGYLLLTHSLSLTQIVNTNTKSTHGATAISLDSNLPSQLFLSLSQCSNLCRLSLTHKILPESLSGIVLSLRFGAARGMAFSCDFSFLCLVVGSLRATHTLSTHTKHTHTHTKHTHSVKREELLLLLLKNFDTHG